MNHRYHYLLIIPSLMRNGAKEIRYSIQGKTYQGRQTNLAATMHIMSQLRNQGQQLTRILMICSDEVLRDPILPEGADTAVTSLQYYQAQISQYARQCQYTDRQIQDLFVVYRQAQLNPGDFDAMDEIQQRICGEICVPGESGLYVDYTGGQRDASMLLVFFARLLEKLGCTVENVLYSKILSPDTGVIESCMSTYQLFNRLDELSFSSYGDLRHLENTAQEIGDRTLAEGIRKTMDAVLKNRAGNYEAAAEAAGSETVSAEGGILNQIMAQAANRQRQRLQVENALTEQIASGNIKSAAHMIRESGIRMLVKKGVVLCPKWLQEDNCKKLGREFTPYAYYYGTYLNFVQRLLEKLLYSGEEEGLYERYQDYMKGHLLLVPSSHPSTGVSSFLVREFNQQQPRIRENLEKRLLEQVQASEITAERLTEAVAEYEMQRNKYLTAYMQSGFPFGNIDGKFSHTFFAVTEEVEENSHIYERTIKRSYPQEYRKLLESGISQLLSQPDPLGKMRALTQDRSLLARGFPPICSPGLFLPADGDLTTFAVRVDILDQVRKNRNLMTHAGEKVDEAFMDAASARILSFAQWLASL